MPEEVELFEPRDWKSLLEGWLIHARKERDKHQECAQKYQLRHQLVSLPAVTLSAIAALPVVASLDPLGEGTALPFELKAAAAALIILAAVFVALDKQEFGATAEKHRAAEFNYKDVIRQIEVAFASRKRDDGRADQVIQETRQAIQERLRVVDAQSPVVLAGVDEKYEKYYKHRVVVTDLAKERKNMPS